MSCGQSQGKGPPSTPNHIYKTRRSSIKMDGKMQIIKTMPAIKKFNMN